LLNKFKYLRKSKETDVPQTHLDTSTGFSLLNLAFNFLQFGPKENKLFWLQRNKCLLSSICSYVHRSISEKMCVIESIFHSCFTIKA